MSLTKAGIQTGRPPGAEERTVNRFTFDTTYPTGGEPCSAADLGLTRVDWAEATIVSATGAGVNVANCDYDVANGKIKLFDETPAEVANAANVATVVVQIVAYGH